MKLLAAPWFAALLILLIQPAVTFFVLSKAGTSLVKSLIPPPKPDLAHLKPKTVQPPWDMWTPEIEKISQELQEKIAALKERELKLAQDEARVASERSELEKTRRDIESRRVEVNQLFTEVTANEAKSLRALAKTYSSLTPPAALSVLEKHDDMTVVKLLAQMKQDIVVTLFEEMAKAPDGPARVASLNLQLMRVKNAPPETK